MTDPATLPPYGRTLGVRTVAIEGAAPLLIMPPGDHVLGRPGFLHGGAIAGLLELAAFAALRHALGDAAVRIKPITVTVDFTRGGRLIDAHAQGRVLRLGTRIANVEAVAWQTDRDRPIAAARVNLLLRRD